MTEENKMTSLEDDMLLYEKEQMKNAKARQELIDMLHKKVVSDFKDNDGMSLKEKNVLVNMSILLNGIITDQEKSYLQRTSLKLKHKGNDANERLGADIVTLLKSIKPSLVKDNEVDKQQALESYNESDGIIDERLKENDITIEDYELSNDSQIEEY